jgi:hypothetical protein
MESRMADEQILIDEGFFTLIAFIVFISRMHRHMSLQANLICQFFTTQAANVFILVHVSVHMLIEGIFRHNHVAKSTTESFWIIGILIHAIVLFILFQRGKPFVTVLAMANVLCSKVFFRSFSFSIKASVLQNSSSSSKSLATCLKIILIIFY